MIPLKDADFVAWMTNAEEKISAAPTDYGLSVAQATQLTTLYTAFMTAYTAASNPTQRNKALTATKQLTKNELLRYGRELYGLVQVSLTVPDDKKVALDVVVPDREPSRRQVPAFAPALLVLAVFGRNVRIAIYDASGQRRRRIPGADGAQLFSFVGDVPPSGADGWEGQGNVFGREAIVEFPASVAPGTKVWLTATWFNTSGPGPACTPVSTYIGFEGAEPLAA